MMIPLKTAARLPRKLLVPAKSDFGRQLSKRAPDALSSEKLEIE